jgi:peptidyl-prolyl cis-trans isomerase B (cyclophilin B)
MVVYFLINLPFSILIFTFSLESFIILVDNNTYTERSIYMVATNPIVTIEMDKGGIIKVELYPAIAPNTVNNFISLVNKNYYNGLIFHRVINGFMIQGGCPDGTGMGGPGYSVKGEFSTNGFDNNLKHAAGVISMARSQMPDSAGSQFFIMHKDSPHLDGSYTAFGQVIEGMELVDEIATCKTDYSDKPKEKQIMKSVTVELFGETYPEPEKC